MPDANPPTVESVPLDIVVTDPTAQSRASVNDWAVADYAEEMADGVVFEPVDTIWDGTFHWVWDGHHRVQAARNLGWSEIAASWQPGVRRDAARLSLSANATHGQRRRNDDKRHAVTRALLDPEWATWSDAAIARLCAVTDRFVAKMRAGPSPNDSGMGPPEPRDVTVKRGGKEYTLSLIHI